MEHTISTGWTQSSSATTTSESDAQRETRVCLKVLNRAEQAVAKWKSCMTLCDIARCKITLRFVRESTDMDSRVGALRSSACQNVPILAALSVAV